MILSPALRAQLLAEAAAAHPRECCGLLEGDGARVTALHPARNLAESCDRFEIDPAVQFRLRREGCNIVGCYHSHPGGAAEPSPRDAQGTGEAGFVWLIVAGEALGAYRWDGVRFERLELA